VTFWEISLYTLATIGALTIAFTVFVLVGTWRIDRQYRGKRGRVWD